MKVRDIKVLPKLDKIPEWTNPVGISSLERKLLVLLTPEFG